MTSSKRVAGLDTLRAFAIILVFMFHYPRYDGGHSVFGLLGNVGWVGVGLFFVLSGYLIGNQIFSSLKREGSVPVKSFFIRRLIRTLPNYLVVLAIYFLIPEFSREPLLTPLWKFLTFTQNFNLETSGFSHAWSLCVEEQFYLFLPLIALVFYKKLTPKVVVVVIASIFLMEMLLRCLLWNHFINGNHTHLMPTMYMTEIYYPTYTRLDGILMGVTLALTKSFRPTLWARLLTKGNYCLVAGILISAITFDMFNNFFNLFHLIPTMIGYPLQDLSFALLLIAAVSPSCFFSRIKVPGLSTVATLSYAIYLTHKGILHVCDQELLHWGVGKFSLLGVLIGIASAIVGAFILYYSIEFPFLKLRDKFWPRGKTPKLLGQAIHKQS